MSKLTDIREEMAAALKDALGEDVQVSAYSLANMSPPTLVIQPGLIRYHGAMQRGHTDWGMRVRAYVSATYDKAAQQNLDRFIGETGVSIGAALEDHSTTVWHDLTVDTCDAYQEYQHSDGTVYLGCEWSVAVMATDN